MHSDVLPVSWGIWGGQRCQDQGCRGGCWGSGRTCRPVRTCQPCRCASRKGNGTPLQYSCLENSMDGGAWWARVHGVAKSWI